MKNRSIKTMIILVLCIITIAACGQKNTDVVDMDLFIGEWKCEAHPLENEEYYTGFIMMNIQEKGAFRMSDVEAGNPVISGKLEFLSDKNLVLKCSTEDDFDPPPTWQSMSEEQEIEYSFTEDGKLHMTYKEGESLSTLVFVRQ
jgi:hypothetical protein